MSTIARWLLDANRQPVLLFAFVSAILIAVLSLIVMDDHLSISDSLAIAVILSIVAFVAGVWRMQQQANVALRRENRALRQTMASDAIARQEKDRWSHFLSESSNDVFWSFDLLGNCENFVSRSAESCYGMPLDELATRPYFWRERAHPDDIDMLSKARLDLQEKGISECSYRILNDQGVSRWVYTREELVRDTKGRPVRIQGRSVDITYLKQTEKIIERQEFQMRALFENLDMAVTIVDADGKILLFNKSAAQLTELHNIGIKKGDNIISNAPENRRLPLQSSLQDVVSTKTSKSYLAEYPVANGSSLHYAVMHVPVLNAIGEVTQICITARDVTEQVAAERKLERERVLLRTIIDNIPDLVYIKDRKSLRRVFQHIDTSGNVHLGTNGKDFTATEQPEPEMDDEIFITGKGIMNQEEEVTDPAGEKHWLLSSKIPVKNNHGEVELIIGISRDITERKRMELDLRMSRDRFAIACQASKDAIWDWDLTTDTAYLSSSFSEQFGHNLGTEGISVNDWIQFVHPEDAPGVQASLNHHLQLRSTARWQHEYRFVCLDGSVAFVRDRGFVIYGEDGRPVRMIGAMQNITDIVNHHTDLEIKVLERTRELNKALAKEKELVQMKSRFVAIASHEFKTPLSTIQFAAGFVKRFHSQLSTEQLLAKMETMEQQVQHMTTLLNDILVIGKAESGAIKVSRQPVELRSFFDKICFEIEKTSGGTHVVVRSYPFESFTIRSEEKFLRNIFINLLSNAIKFSPGKPFVFLSFTLDAERIRIHVRDQGIGIEEHELKNIFDAFHRSDRVRDIEGTGLGLSIVRKATDLLDGHVEVTSKIGEGTTFTITLPLYE